MDEKEEQIYGRGSRAAWLQMLQLCLQNLDMEDRSAHLWVSEREQVIAALRPLCDEFGDNEWDEHLHLADVINKHLGDHLLSE